MAEPRRTCVGCRRVDDRSMLTRLVWDVATAQVIVDAAKCLPGRGAWIHAREACVAAACRRRSIGRALRRGEVDHDRIRTNPAFGFNNGAESG